MFNTNLVVLLLAAATHHVTSRAVNITTQWALPQEGFPHFFRYFKDPASWDNANDICGSFGAQLVTAETGERRDAIRAYLKELDVIENVWYGLQRVAGDTPFVWSGGGQSDVQDEDGQLVWQESPPLLPDRLCVSTNPQQDFRWQGSACDQQLSFLCQLPVPEWATGPNGCISSSLPSLTVTYLPEPDGSGAIQLISDCGLAGTKTIACKGPQKEDELIKRLSCGGDEEPWSWVTVGMTRNWGSSGTRHKRESTSTQTYTETPLTGEDTTVDPTKTKILDTAILQPSSLPAQLLPVEQTTYPRSMQEEIVYVPPPVLQDPRVPIRHDNITPKKSPLPETSQTSEGSSQDPRIPSFHGNITPKKSPLPETSQTSEDSSQDPRLPSLHDKITPKKPHTPTTHLTSEDSSQDPPLSSLHDKITNEKSPPSETPLATEGSLQDPQLTSLHDKNSPRKTPLPEFHEVSESSIQDPQVPSQKSPPQETYIDSEDSRDEVMLTQMSTLLTLPASTEIEITTPHPTTLSRLPHPPLMQRNSKQILPTISAATTTISSTDKTEIVASSTDVTNEITDLRAGEQAEHTIFLPKSFVTGWKEDNMREKPISVEESDQGKYRLGETPEEKVKANEMVVEKINPAVITNETRAIEILDENYKSDEMVDEKSRFEVEVIEEKAGTSDKNIVSRLNSSPKTEQTLLKITPDTFSTVGGFQGHDVMATESFNPFNEAVQYLQSTENSAPANNNHQTAPATDNVAYMPAAVTAASTGKESTIPPSQVFLDSSTQNPLLKQESHIEYMPSTVRPSNTATSTIYNVPELVDIIATSEEQSIRGETHAEAAAFTPDGLLSAPQSPSSVTATTKLRSIPQTTPKKPSSTEVPIFKDDTNESAKQTTLTTAQPHKTVQQVSTGQPEFVAPIILQPIAQIETVAGTQVESGSEYSSEEAQLQVVRPVSKRNGRGRGLYHQAGPLSFYPYFLSKVLG